MKKKIKIKLFNIGNHLKNNGTKIIVVGFNNKVNGAYIEKIGVFYKEHNTHYIFIRYSRLLFWLSRGAIMKNKVYWMLGLLGHSELQWKKKNNET